MTRLKKVAIDGGTGIATVGAGTRLVDLYGAMAHAGRAMPGGTCATVGIAGLALGGGHGVVGRSFGLTCDAMTSATVVVADGTVITCDAHRNPDLFWACRAAGAATSGS